jgi:hypothetical protein
MNKKSLGGLIVVNVVLLAVLGVLSFTPQTVQAQNRRPGDYVMVAGSVAGQAGSVVYVTDLNNQAMITVIYDQNSKSMKAIAGRDITADLSMKGGGR